MKQIFYMNFPGDTFKEIVNTFAYEVQKQYGIDLFNVQSDERRKFSVICSGILSLLLRMIILMLFFIRLGNYIFRLIVN